MPLQTGQQIPAVYNNQGPDSYIGVGSALTLTQDYTDKTFFLNALTGSVATLPPAIGAGARFKFVVTVINTSNSHKVQVANSNDFMIGQAMTIDSATVTGYAAVNSTTVSTNSDTIAFNGTTTGGLKAGDYIIVEDVALNTWFANVVSNSSGTAATPFSAAV